jgi:hypothetical protein
MITATLTFRNPDHRAVVTSVLHAEIDRLSRAVKEIREIRDVAAPDSAAWKELDAVLRHHRDNRFHLVATMSDINRARRADTERDSA